MFVWTIKTVFIDCTDFNEEPINFYIYPTEWKFTYVNLYFNKTEKAYLREYRLHENQGK